MNDLRDILHAMPGMAVAVSGGVDSLTLATQAHSLGVDAHMFHATSPAVPAEATGRVSAEAVRQGWVLHIFDAGEFADASYRANPVNRCFFCKINLYGAIAARTGRQIVSGTNTDDLGEYRPGLDAAKTHAVRHPFVEAGIGKTKVRALAQKLGLGELADLPSAPCLASRIETGLRIEAPMLAMVHEVEKRVATLLRPRTVRCRVRASGVVVELDAQTMQLLNDEAACMLREDIRALGMAGPVSFALYRTGSAFVRPAA
jgi:uncharacterized protein